MLGDLYHRRGANGQLWPVFVHGIEVLFQRGAHLHLHAFGLEPFDVVCVPLGGRTGRAHIAHIGTAFDEQTAYQQLRAFVATEGDATRNRLLHQEPTHLREGLVARHIDLRLRDASGLANVLQPVLCAFQTHRGRTHHRAARSLEFAHAGGVERVDGCSHAAVERGIELAPLAGRHHRTRSQAHGGEHLANDDRIGREHLTQQGHRGQVTPPGTRSGHRAADDFFAGVFQHRPGQHVFGFGMGGHTKTGHVDADDAHAIDLFGQELQRHATGGRHTQVDDHDGVHLVRIRFGVHRIADVFKQLARDQRLGVEGHITHTASSAVKMRCESESVHAAGRAGQDGGGALHAQAHAQRAKGRTHALRLVVWAGIGLAWVVAGVLVQHLRLARLFRPRHHGIGARVTAHAVALQARGVHSR